MIRLNIIMQLGLLPFNFGMTHKDYITVYNIQPELVGTDPNTWTEKQIQEINDKALQELKLFDYLNSLSDEKFNEYINANSKRFNTRLY